MGKREVIVWVSGPLTKEQRRNFKKEHPGKRLSFYLRYPSLSMYLLPVISLIVSIIVLVLRMI